MHVCFITATWQDWFFISLLMNATELAGLHAQENNSLLEQKFQSLRFHGITTSRWIARYTKGLTPKAQALVPCIAAGLAGIPCHVRVPNSSSTEHLVLFFKVIVSAGKRAEPAHIINRLIAIPAWSFCLQAGRAADTVCMVGRSRLLMSLDGWIVHNALLAKHT